MSDIVGWYVISIKIISISYGVNIVNNSTNALSQSVISHSMYKVQGDSIGIE